MVEKRCRRKPADGVRPPVLPRRHVPGSGTESEMNQERKDFMKLIYAIVRYDNEDEVISALTKKHYSITKLATTGGFLKKGNTTLLIGTEAEHVSDVIETIKQECGKRQKITINMPYISGAAMMNCATMPMTVEVGGATIFVIDVEHYEKI